MRGNRQEKYQFFRFLRRLRSEGRSNMYGAVPYLMSAFGLDRETSFRIICEWVDQQVEPSPAPPGGPRGKLPRRSAA